MSERRAPVVGVPCFEAERAGSRRPLVGNNLAYVQALTAAGAAPVLIPPGLDDQALRAICGRLDGLLLTGGADVDPALYGEERQPFCQEPEPERDRLELAMVARALEDDLPVLGICRGMQTLNVALGGDLYQDIEAQEPGKMRHALSDLPRDHRAHEVTLEPGSRLAKIVGAERVAVNSLHHQAVRRVGNGARVVAWATDGVAEGMEAPEHRFVVAVQYHPEELAPTDEASRRLFAAFVAACREGEA